MNFCHHQQQQTKKLYWCHFWTVVHPIMVTGFGVFM